MATHRPATFQGLANAGLQADATASGPDAGLLLGSPDRQKPDDATLPFRDHPIACLLGLPRIVGQVVLEGWSQRRTHEGPWRKSARDGSRPELT